MLTSLFFVVEDFLKGILPTQSIDFGILNIEQIDNFELSQKEIQLTTISLE